MRLYALTIFVSAFLLFQIQPVITRAILPWFGGSAAVWTVCLLFFQVTLLLGYLYSHCIITYLKPKNQKILHITLLIVSLISLPIIPREALKPIGGEDPTFKILLLLLATVGMPYFLLSTTGPLLQGWFEANRKVSGETLSPYRLYALSNGGSMLALISYPILIEPWFTTRFQAIGWSISFVIFVSLCVLVAWKLKTPDKVDTENMEEISASDIEIVKPSWALQLLWVGLAACSCTLLLSITTHLSENIAAIPFLWVAPLSLYLLSFIFCFAGKSWKWKPAFLAFPALLIAAMAYTLTAKYQVPEIKGLIALFSAGLFVCCMVCHGELARLRPHPRYLTNFYLMLSLGGALGGVFVGAIAPRVFQGNYELPIALCACAIFCVGLLYKETTVDLKDISWFALIVGVVVLILSFISHIKEERKTYQRIVRNFYGTLRVSEYDGAKHLVNGTITHGIQFLDPEKQGLPTSYYAKESGVGLAIEAIKPAINRKIGVIGLGTGTVAAYGKPGDVIHYYEINPLDVDIAKTDFTYLKNCKGKVELVLGDARLSMEKEAPQNFDVLAVDAFSGDAIPVHLLTKEAFDLYFKNLKPDGILAVHVSNQYLDLVPVVEKLATNVDKESIYVLNDGDEERQVSTSAWVLVAKRGRFKGTAIQSAGTPPKVRKDLRLWTDDYSNLFQILKRE